MAATPSETEPTELPVSGVEAGYADRIRSVLNGEAPYVFARRAGIGKSYMYEVLGGTKAPSLAFFSSIAETAGVRSDWLISGRGMPNEGWNGRTALIPRLEIGTNASLIDGGDQVLVEIDRLAGISPAKAAAISAPDSGMAPMIEIGDDLIVELEPSGIVDGQVYLIRSSASYILRKLKTIDDNNIIMISGSNSPASVSIETYSAGTNEIHARVAAIWKKLR
ncbi:hypothetical protein [Methylobacterium sp. Leaf361]|uniref:LexA family transcriptional regulator n=1 Tax=Methylobacterium sp. Leaf361 TaxID=1736352 RepID=UPI0012FECE2B|nr:hypothetical protein [Methylobacterium sp. Leaf361]